MAPSPAESVRAFCKRFRVEREIRQRLQVYFDRLARTARTRSSRRLWVLSSSRGQFVIVANAHLRNADLRNAWWWRRQRPNTQLRVLNGTRRSCAAAAGDGGSARAAQARWLLRACSLRGLMPCTPCRIRLSPIGR